MSVWTKEMERIPTERSLRVAFAYGLRALVEVFPSDEKWKEQLQGQANVVMAGGQIDAKSRLVQDRFAIVCSDLRIMGDDYETARRMIFERWSAWK